MSVVAFAVGAVIWTCTEYVAHRFTMHNVGGRGPAAGEHLRHHAEPARTRPVVRLAGHLSMYSIAVGLAVIAAFVLPALIAAAAAAGWALGYTAYEWLHHAAHHHEPRGEWDLRLRKRHFHHHFVAPRQNLGVTTSVWDRLLRSEDPNAGAQPIRVPPRLVMPWLVGPDGAIRPDYANDYVLARPLSPRRTAAEIREADRTRAFADLAPATGVDG